jgi:phosphoribosylglycinamide formyltransferase-1
MNKKIRIGALISGSGTNLQDVIDACKSGKIDGDMVFVGTDNRDAPGLDRAKDAHIPVFVTDYKAIIQRFGKESDLPDDFDLDEMLSKQSLFPPDEAPEKVKRFLFTRAIAEADLLQNIKPYAPDLLILAGFMRTLTPYFIDRMNTDPELPCIMNIHPALLPMFPGTDGYGDTFRYGCKIAGCTVHFVDYGEDSGPIIGQRAFEIQENDTLESVIKKGLIQEWILYPQCIQYFAQRRLKIGNSSYRTKDGKTRQRRVVKIK